jgi:hypothetical protein
MNNNNNYNFNYFVTENKIPLINTVIGTILKGVVIIMSSHIFYKCWKEKSKNTIFNLVSRSMILLAIPLIIYFYVEKNNIDKQISKYKCYEDTKCFQDTEEKAMLLYNIELWSSVAIFFISFLLWLKIIL